MRQSTVIFGALIIGFVVFITLRGELPKYLAVLGLGSSGVSTALGTTAADEMGGLA